MSTRSAGKRAPGAASRPGPAYIELHSFLAYRLTKLAYRLTRSLAAIYIDAQQLTSSEWKVLSILAETAGLNGTEISQRSTLDRFAVNKAVRKLLDRGLVERDPAPSGGRAVLIALTDRGWEVYGPIAKQALQQQEHLLAALTAREQALLFTLMNKIEHKMDEEGLGRPAAGAHAS